MYILWYSFFKRVFGDWVGFPGWRPSPPLAYVDNATSGSLIWFPFWQIRGYPSFPQFLYHIFLSNIESQLTYKKKFLSFLIKKIIIFFVILWFFFIIKF
jgi:hypothetical protein